MSTVTRPRGPLPPRVYWTRRLMLLAIACLLLWLVVRWIGGGDSGASASGGEEPAAATTSDDGDTAGSDASGHKSRDKDRTAQIRTVAESFERPHENCDLTQVLVTPTVADPVYAGEPAVVTLRISTSSSTACSLTIDADHLLLSITSGHDTVWDSTRCEDAIPTRDLALQPRWSALVDVTWSGLYSGRRCPSDGTAAEPGTYSIEAAVLEGEPTEADFELVKRPDPVEDDKTKGDDKGSDDSDQSSDKSSGDSSSHGDKSSDDTDKSSDDDPSGHATDT